MAKKPAALVAALLMAAVAGLMAIPSCRIQLCKGSGCGGGPDTGGWGGGGSAGSDSGGWGGSGGIGEVDTAADAAVLANSDPVELSRAQLKSNVASYMLWGYVQQNVDPAIVAGGDPDALANAAQEVLDIYGAEIWAYADQYVDALDPAVLPAATVVVPDHTCITKFGCASTMFCSFEFAGEGEKLVPCHITGCGEGACPACPDLFDLDKLIVKHFCSFTCVKDQKSVVGIGIQVHLQINRRLDGCWLFAKPVPCTGVGCPGGG